MMALAEDRVCDCCFLLLGFDCTSAVDGGEQRKYMGEESGITPALAPTAGRNLSGWRCCVEELVRLDQDMVLCIQFPFGDLDIIVDFLNQGI